MIFVFPGLIPTVLPVLCYSEHPLAWHQACPCLSQPVPLCGELGVRKAALHISQMEHFPTSLPWTSRPPCGNPLSGHWADGATTALSSRCPPLVRLRLGCSPLWSALCMLGCGHRGYHLATHIVGHSLYSSWVSSLLRLPSEPLIFLPLFPIFLLAFYTSLCRFLPLCQLAL